ncbi:hypothetical protein XENOCAPTIV_009147 [Xenoophorus captivus]|uniref:Uncharacterized protein n=1 Tax=Xenoophorus captivus TaxID=1517983 RepID=A0ABV0RVA5_9TELE
MGLFADSPITAVPAQPVTLGGCSCFVRIAVELFPFSDDGLTGFTGFLGGIRLKVNKYICSPHLGQLSKYISFLFHTPIMYNTVGLSHKNQFVFLKMAKCKKV